MKNIVKTMLLIGLVVSGCEDFLDAKPDMSLVVPDQLTEFQAILDAEPRQMNYSAKIPLLGSDEMMLGSAAFPRLNQEEICSYRWSGDYYAVNDFGTDWVFLYQAIYYANVVLEGMRDFDPQNEGERQFAKRLEGSAKFYRAWGHFQLMQIYAPPFDPEAESQPGIPIREFADINISTGLSNQREVIDFILKDLEEAIFQLPLTSDLKTRPSQWAVEALKSRIYLQIQDYENAFEAGSNALEIGRVLMDFNALPTGGTYKFPRFNPEVIFHANVPSSGFTFYREQWIDPSLYALYESDDLRKTVLFTLSRIAGRYNFTARYSGDFFDWGGLAVDEVVLNRAEAGARTGRDDQALDDLNYLLGNRYRTGFTPMNLLGKDLLDKILEERRKELVFRGIRWMDLRRLNQDPDYSQTLTRTIGSETYSLAPGGTGYTIPIPPRELTTNPNLK